MALIPTVTLAKSTLLEAAEKDEIVLKGPRDDVRTYDVVWEPTRRENEVRVVPISLLGELFIANLAAGG
jgi:hypothetical protein